jgi:hypothetical protein
MGIRTLVVFGMGLALLLGTAASAVAAAGSVAGTITVTAVPAAPAPLPVFKHKEVCGDSVADERLIVGPGGGLRYAVVTIKGVTGGRPVERDLTHVLDNVGCRFAPHVQVAEVGQWLEIRNSDPILHNADAKLGKRTLFNVALPPARRVRKPLAEPGLIAFTCNVRHTWMSAYVAVASDPYHTVTDAYGEYEIADLPPGTYTLEVWHERLGVVERPLTVVAGETAVVDVAYPAPGDGKKEEAR